MGLIEFGRMFASRDAVKWEFIKGDDGWTWRKTLDNGKVVGQAKAQFPDCERAIGDASANGFRPRVQRWAITTEFGTTHFEFPRPPAFVPRRDAPPLTTRFSY